MLAKLLIGFILGLLPFYEPRYLPVYFTRILGFPLWLATLLSVVDCIILAALLTLLLGYADSLLEQRFANSRFSLLRRISELYASYKRRLLRKHSRKLELYGALALMAFVAVPLPLTGMWSGAILSLALELDARRRFLVLCLGGLLAIAFVAGSLGILNQIT
jgi:uncharacterized membrane protein